MLPSQNKIVQLYRISLTLNNNRQLLQLFLNKLFYVKKQQKKQNKKTTTTKNKNRPTLNCLEKQIQDSPFLFGSSKMLIVTLPLMCSRGSREAMELFGRRRTVKLLVG